MNNFIAIGTVSIKGDLRQTPKGTDVITFNIAVRRRFKKDGEYVTDFFKCSAFGMTAGYVNQYVNVGDTVAIRGELHINSTERDGQKRQHITCQVDTVDTVRRKQVDNRQPAQQKPVQQQPIQQHQQQVFEPVQTTYAIEDDDLPF